MLGMCIIVTVCRAEGGPTRTAAHGVHDGEFLPVGALDVVTVPGVALVFMISLMLTAKGCAAGTAVPLALDRDGSAGRVVADELARPPLLAETPVLVAMFWAYALAALAG
jgi:hypothetical protein